MIYIIECTQLSRQSHRQIRYCFRASVCVRAKKNWTVL